MQLLVRATLLVASLNLMQTVCADDRPYPCEAETAKLMKITSSWNEIYKSAIALSTTCFDGYFAEGISDTIVRKMRKDWRGFLVVLTKHGNESKFMKLVSDSINATLDPNDIRAIGYLAETSCLPEIRNQCRTISNQASTALSEYDPPEPRWAQ
jgi:hypothetical protein